MHWIKCVNIYGVLTHMTHDKGYVNFELSRFVFATFRNMSRARVFLGTEMSD